MRAKRDVASVTRPRCHRNSILQYRNSCSRISSTLSLVCVVLLKSTFTTLQSRMTNPLHRLECTTKITCTLLNTSYGLGYRNCYIFKLNYAPVPSGEPSKHFPAQEAGNSHENKTNHPIQPNGWCRCCCLKHHARCSRPRQGHWTLGLILRRHGLTH